MDLQYLVYYLFIFVNVLCRQGTESYVTQTVYGFLDFTTTIGDTVMVFSPQSAPPLDFTPKTEPPAANIIKTEPILKQNEKEIKPSKISVSTVENVNVKSTTSKEVKPVIQSESVKTEVRKETKVVVAAQQVEPQKQQQQQQQQQQQPQVVEATSSDESETKNLDNTEESVVKIENNINQPEYDLLSRQPTEYAEESFRVINHNNRGQNQDRVRPHKRPNQHANNNAPANGNSNSNTNNPVGLVTKLTGTEENNGVTTLYETSVIGTYISGKYAQVLQSTSHVQNNRQNNNNSNNKKAAIRPSSSLRILKTAAPVSTVKGTSVVAAPKPPPRQSNSPNRLRNKKHQASKTTAEPVVIVESSPEPIQENFSTKKSSSRNKSKRRHKSSSSSSSSKASNNVDQGNSGAAARRNFRPKIQHTTPENDLASTSLYMFKLNRQPGRWQYKTSPKPRVAIRKFSNDGPPNNTTLLSPVSNDANSPNINAILEQGDLESSGSQNGAVLNNIDQEDKQKLFVETLNVEISTPDNFKSTYYELATIKTPYIFQAGVVRKTRFITVTSTIEKIVTEEPTMTASLTEPLIENILAPSTSRKPEHLGLDGSVTTLNPVYLTNDAETPALETVTETLTFTQTKLRTQILPLVYEDKNETTLLTLVQTYDLTTLVTATKTLSPYNDDQFLASKNFKDFSGNLDEAGSELNLELEFGDEDNIDADERHIKAELPPPQQPANKAVAPAQSNPTNQANLTPEQIKQLNVINLYNPSQSQLSTVITTSRPVLVHETLWESHVVPIINGANTNYRTLSKSIGTIDKTEYRLETSTILLPSLSPPPQPLSVNPYLLPLNPNQFQTITTPVVHQTIATQTNSKILKLTFGAKTAYTTLYSTQVVPTTLTMFITTSLPVQPTAAFPGYFPPPYPPFPYLG